MSFTSGLWRGTAFVRAALSSRRCIRSSRRYTSYDFGKALAHCGVLASMGAVGTAHDNAMCESFFAT